MLEKLTTEQLSSMRSTGALDKIAETLTENIAELTHSLTKLDPNLADFIQSYTSLQIELHFLKTQLTFINAL